MDAWTSIPPSADLLYSLLFSDVHAALMARLWSRLMGRSASAGPGIGGGAPLPPTAFDDLIQEAAARYRVDPDLVKAVVKAESNFDPTAVSHAGAKGLMQLMDTTAAALGVENVFDPAQNIDAGVRYLAQQLERFGDVRLALAAYNAGPGAVNRYGGIPPYAETQTYVRRVLDFYASGSVLDTQA